MNGESDGGATRTVTVYGLANCDTCRKARKWLASEGVAHRFHDVRADGLDPAALDAWIAAVGWEVLLNRRGTTWRGLPAAETAGIDGPRARDLMLRHPALVKRPVFDTAGRIIVGFGPKEQAALRAG